MAEASFFGTLLGRRSPAEPGDIGSFADLRTPQKGYVFVVSYGQSGDLLIQDVLNAASGVVIRGENGNLLRPMALAWHHAERHVLAAIAANEDTAAYQFENLTILGWHLANSFVRDVLNLPAGTQLGGFREIRFHGSAQVFRQQLDFMAAFFPNARFLFNTRDVSHVAQTGWWREQDADKVARTISGADTLFDLYAKINPERCLHLNYDHYSSDPAQLGMMFDWLDLQAPEAEKITSIVQSHRSKLEAEVGI